MTVATEAADLRRLCDRVFAPVTQAYDERDTILYALGLGLGPLAAADPRLLPYVHETRLRTIPSQVAVLAGPGAWMMDPQAGIDWRSAVASWYAIDLHAPLPPRGTVSSAMRIDGVFDRGPGRGAVIQWRRDVRDEDAGGHLLAVIRSTMLARGNGGFGGPAWPGRAASPVPDRAPDLRFEWQTTPAQPLLYRLCGDRNPLHADPDVARAAGFEGPILHGLCTLGIACFELQAWAAQGRVLRGIEARFTAVVYPGDHLLTEVWTEGRDLLFRMSVPARGVVVLDAGLATTSGNQP